MVYFIFEIAIFLILPLSLLQRSGMSDWRHNFPARHKFRPIDSMVLKLTYDSKHEALSKKRLRPPLFPPIDRNFSIFVARVRALINSVFCLLAGDHIEITCNHWLPPKRGCVLSTTL